ncbi:MAG TPA: restriction endonuclease subunit S [Candidatus Omnitrophota bacterium]|nr:restriction endonuclease subunit S [Candidatus Omnitrophota bacterium]
MENKLPKGWISSPLKDVVSSRKGKKPAAVISHEKKGYDPYILIDELEGKPARSFTNDPKVPRAKKEDVLLVWDGSIGKCASGMTGAVGSTMAVLSPKNGLNTKFLEYFIRRSKNFILETSTGTGLQHINKNFLKTAEISFPSDEEEQKSIADKLDSLLAKVKDAQSRLDTIPVILSRFRQSVLAAAFSGELTKTWRIENNTLNAEDDLALIREFILKSEITNREKKNFEEITKISLASYEEQFNFPSSWVACCIGFIGVVNNGSTPSRKITKYWNGSIPWISSGEVRNNKISASRERITQEGLDNCSSKLFPTGTVLIAMIGEGKTRGQSAILNIEAAINQNIAAVQIAHGRVNPEYLWYWFHYQYENNRSFGSGSGPQALNCQRVRELPFVFAPKAEQDQIVSKVKSSFSALDGFVERYIKSKSYTDKLEQSILAKAFRGELVV